MNSSTSEFVSDELEHFEFTGDDWSISVFVSNELKYLSCEQWTQVFLGLWEMESSISEFVTNELNTEFLRGRERKEITLN